MRLPLAVRRAAARVLAPIRVPIQAGPNEGCLCSLPVSGRYRSGDYEEERVRLLESLLRRGDCFWDVGAHHGYISVMASRMVDRDGEVLAFEPSAYNHSYLRRHLRWNGCENVSAFRVAVAGTTGEASFGGSGSSQTFGMGGGEERVETVAFGELLASRFRPPDVLKIDVEGAETEILESGGSALPPDAVVLVSLHSDTALERCAEELNRAQFEVLVSEGARELYGGGRWSDDPDLLAVGPRRARGLVERIREDYGFDWLGPDGGP